MVMAEIVPDTTCFRDALPQHLVLLALYAEQILHRFVSFIGDDLFLQIFHEENHEVAQHEHAEKQQDTRQKCETADRAAADRTGEQQDHGGRNERQQPGRHAEIKDLYGHQRLQDTAQKCRHRPKRRCGEEQRDDAGLPGMEVEVDVVLAQEEGGGTDRQQVVNDEDELEDGDPDISFYDVNRQCQEDRERQILYIDARKSGLYQQCKQAEIGELPQEHGDDRPLQRVAEVIAHREEAQWEEWQGIQHFVDDQFAHSVSPSLNARNV